MWAVFKKELKSYFLSPIGYVVIAKNELSTNQGFKNFLPSDDYLPQYLYWYLKGNKELLESYASGTTFLELSASKAKMIEFPLAPKKTQQKIVDIIESLFAKLDIVQEKVEQVLAESENRRSAILHKAFSGKLTEKWRKENGVLFDSWKNKAIGEFSFVTKLAGFEYSNNIYPNLCSIGIPLFKGKNVRDGELLLNFESFIPKEVSDELPRSQLNKKCILTPYVGTIGNVAIFDDSFHAHLGSNVGKIEISSDTTEEYLVYYLRSHFGYQELTKEKKATAQESISIKAIRNVSVILPTLPEQKEIVRLLDKLLFVEDKVKSTCQNTLEAIATMRKSILAKAFRRELCS